MGIFECEKCGRGFLPKSKKYPIISGRSVAKREEEELFICPHCGTKQKSKTLMFPV